jgi:Flp pilus assembly pilin Flp
LKTKVVGFATDIKNDVDTAFNDLKNLLTGGSEEGDNGVVGTIKSGVKGAFDTLKTKVVGFATDIKNDVDTAFNTLKNNVNTIATDIKDTFLLPFRTIKTTLLGESGNEDNSGLIGRTVGGVRDAFANLSNYLTSKFDLSGLTSAFDNAINPVKNTIDSLIERVNELLGLIDDIQVPDVDVTSEGGGNENDGSVLNRDPNEIPTSELETKEEQLGSKTGLSEVQQAELEAIKAELETRDTDADPETDSEERSGEEEDSNNDGVNDSVPGDSVTRERGSAGAATGGFVASTGRAIIHEGERVVPEAQITDRGQVETSSGGITIENLTVNADSRSGGRTAGRALKRELKRFDI